MTISITMPRARRWAALPLLLLCFGAAEAQRPDNLEPVPDPPPTPAAIRSGDAMPLGEPQITIFRRGGNRVKEYRLNGHLYAVKITPEHGEPYYLIDRDGDGHMEGRLSDADNERLLLPMWVIHRW